MVNPYEELMDKIKVTSEMRGRILERISMLDFDRAKPVPAKWLGRRNIRRMLSAAACLLLVLAGGIAGHFLGQEPADPDPVVISSGVQQYESRQALSEAVGFAVEDAAGLPFTPDRTDYAAMDGIAEITYTKGEQSVSWRKAKGEGQDVSGDYQEYDDIRSLKIDGAEVTVKGSGGVHYLAVWSGGGYSCALAAADGCTLEQYQRMLEETMNTMTGH